MLILFVLKIIIAFIFITVPTGFIFNYYLLPDDFKKHQLLIAPITGLATVAVILALVDSFGIAVGRFIIPYSAIAFIFMLGLIFIKKEKLRFPNMAILAVSLTLFVIAVFPVFKAGYIGIYKLTVNDAVVYTSLADHLKENSSKQPLQFKRERTYDAYIAARLKTGIRLGPMYVLSSVNKLVSADSIKTFQIYELILYALATISMYLFSLLTLKFKEKTALLSAFLYGINTLVLHGSYTGYLAQTTILPILPVAVMLGVHFFKNMNIRLAVAYIIFISANITLFPQSIYYSLMLPVVFFLPKIFVKKERNIKLAATWSLVLVLVTSAISYPSLIRTLTVTKWLTASKTRALAGPIAQNTPQTQMLGIGDHYHLFTSDASLSFNLFTWPFFGLAIILMLLYLFKERNRLLITGFALYIVLAALLVSIGFPYGLYKHMALSVFLFASTLAGAIAYFYRKTKSLYILGMVASIITIVFVSFITFSYSRTNPRPYNLVNKRIFQIKPNIYSFIGKKEDLAVIAETSVVFEWVMYVLSDHEVPIKSNMIKNLPSRFFEASNDRFKINKDTRYFILNKGPYYHMLSKELQIKRRKEIKKTGVILWENHEYIFLKRFLDR